MSIFRSLFACGVLTLAPTLASSQTFPGTKPLEIQGDLARRMLDGIDRYLDRLSVATAEKRSAAWKVDTSSNEAFFRSVQPHRERFRKIIGVVDARPAFQDVSYVGGTGSPTLAAEGKTYKVHAVRWPALEGMYAEGLLLEPNQPAKGGAIVLPDADQTPEQWVGLAAGIPAEGQVARRLAEQGWSVLVPTLIDRNDAFSGSPKIGRYTNQPHREFVYRMAYEMGRHVVGYEVQKVLAGVDWFEKRKLPKIAVWGWGEGGLIALYSAAADVRIVETHVSGYVQPRENLHREPIYRNVWNLLSTFGDAELLLLAGSPHPGRSVEVEASREPNVKGPAAPAKGRAGGAAPGTLGEWTPEATGKEWDRFVKLAGTPFPGRLSQAETVPFAAKSDEPAPKDLRLGFDSSERQRRQVAESVAFTQNLIPALARKRYETFWSKLDLKSIDAFKESQKPLREKFWTDLIGKLPQPSMPLNPRTRLLYDTPKWKGYEVVLDVYDDVISYGILLVPNDIKPGEKRPAIVCQHGLEGRPTDVTDPTKKTQYYNSFGAQLADQGYVVFAPQNPYIFRNDFRQVVRKANPLGQSLYAFIVRQHERILEFLNTLPFVDGTKIAYYGLSYGGKVAMRIPALLDGYCLSICSGDFNEWVWKNVNLDWIGSYMFTGEYEMYEFDLASTFNYAEMAALIAPRPFMVERGHDDGVGLDEYVAFEFAKVRRFYSRLGIADRTEIEFFAGGHEINGKGAFAFLRKHLKGQ